MATSDGRIESEREVESWAETARQGREAGLFDPDLPVSVILTGSAGPLTGFRAVQAAPAQASRHGAVDYVDATHATMLNSGHAEVIIRAVERVAAAGV